MPSEATANYRGVFLFFTVLALIAWAAPVRQDWIITPRLMLVVLALGAGWMWLIHPPAGKHEPPDVLRDRIGDYYERDGLCFALTLALAEGLCWFRIFCQNRYGGECVGTIYFIPMEGMSKTGSRHEVPPVVVDVQCEGGECGVVSVPYPIAKNRQGTIMIYDVYAAVQYPNGKGKMLRSRAGAAVEQPPRPVENALRTLRTASLLVFGFVPIEGRSASVELRLPENVHEEAPPDAQDQTEVLWRLSDFATGFPVVEKRHRD